MPLLVKLLEPIIGELIVNFPPVLRVIVESAATSIRLLESNVTALLVSKVPPFKIIFVVKLPGAAPKLLSSSTINVPSEILVIPVKVFVPVISIVPEPFLSIPACVPAAALSALKIFPETSKVTPFATSNPT